MRGISSEQWRVRVSAWVASGQTAEEYGRSRGIDGRQLRSWKWKLSREDRLRSESRPAFVPLRAEPGARPVEAREALEVTFGSGIVVRIPAEIGNDALMSLIERVRSLAC